MLTTQYFIFGQRSENAYDESCPTEFLGYADMFGCSRMGKFLLLRLFSY